jgi:predicted AAA+ superfamily ATPase
MELNSKIVERGRSMYIRRHIEPVVARMAKRKPVVVLTGARQVGKSTMLRECFDEFRYVALNRPLVRESAKENPSLFFEIHKPPVIVDEIQKAAELFDYIKDIVDEDKTKGQFYLTGSQSLRLMKNIGDSLAGRAGVIKMQGLSMREIAGIPYRKPFLPVQKHMEEMENNGTSFDYEKIATCIHKGFFPELYETEYSLEDLSDYYSSYFQTYIEKDIRDALNIKDESAFIRFVKAAASLTGEMLNLSTIAEMCGKDVKTVRAWLSAMESGGLVYLLEPYYNNYKKRLVKTPKLYFLDTGLACWLLGWHTPEQLTNGAVWGHMFESFVFAEILKSYYNDGVTNPPLYYYRDKDKNEIDLIIAEGDVLHPVEIKTAGDPTKSVTKAFRCLDGVPGKTRGTGAVICLVKERLPLTEAAWALPAHLI